MRRSSLFRQWNRGGIRFPAQFEFTSENEERTARRWLLLAASLIVSLALLGCLAVEVPSEEEECPEFGYEEDNGPLTWASLCPTYSTCGDGTEQSPVDLTEAAEGELGGVDFAYRPQIYEVVNTGETIRADAPEGNEIMLDGVRYALIQFHFHQPGEHTVDGTSFPMEMHLVHRSDEGELAVVGLLVEAGESNATLAPLFNALPPTRGAMTTLEAPIDLAEVLPADRMLFRYSGSLTTPPCTEGVKWNVLAASIELSSGQIQVYDALYDFSSNRPVQPLNDRVITLIP